MSQIVTNGLISYYHSNQGVSGNTWNNIAPATIGKYNGVITGATNQAEGMYFDGIDDSVVTPAIQSVDGSNKYEIEVYFKTPLVDVSEGNILGLYGATTIDMETYYQEIIALGVSDDGLTVAPPDETIIYNTTQRNTIKKISMTIDIATNTYYVYVDDVLVGGNIIDAIGVKLYNLTSGSLSIGAIYYNGDFFSPFIGHIISMKIYNRHLTNNERVQNSSVGTNVGLQPVTVTNPPNPVSNLRSTSILNEVIDLDWDDATNASQYIITRNGVQIAEVYASQFKDTGLNKNSTYTYGVISKNSIGIASPTYLSVITKNMINTTILEDFEDTNLNFTFTGDWIRATNVALSASHSGSCALRSKVIGDNSKSTSTFQFNIPSGAINIEFEFKFKVSSEQSWDKFTASINSVNVVNQVSGEVNWTTYRNTSLSAGTHVIKFEYSKDGSANSGLDLVYIDDIMLKYDIDNSTSSSVPLVSSIVTNKSKISDETGMNQSVITFQFDKNVEQYVARLNGSNQDTGVLIDSGGAVLANTNIQITVDWNELASEGLNRINIYGKNASGWTPYT